MEQVPVFEFFSNCAKENDAVSWNQFRKSNRKLSIDLSDQRVSEYTLDKFNLVGVDFSGANLSMTKFHHCLMNSAKFVEAECYGVEFDHCNLVSAQMNNSNLAMANFQECDMRFGDFSNCKIHQVHMYNCQLDNSVLFNASFNDTDLQGSTFKFCDLRECEFSKVELEDCNFEASMVDGKTILWDCYYNRNTNFTGVGLSSCRIEPVLISSFQCNIRRLWWHNWYEEKQEDNKKHLDALKKHPLTRCYELVSYAGQCIVTIIVKAFWWMTDYGSSTIRLLLVFACTTLFFSTLYAIFPITNDVLLNTSMDPVRVFVRALYFAIVVNTGLGFGEINASESSIAGHLVISLQSLFGYILLGAFLVRIGILFQGEFPVAAVRKNTNTTRNQI